MLNQLEFTEQLYQKMLGHDGFSNHIRIKEFNLSGCQINVVGKQGEMFTCYTDTIYGRYLKNPEAIDAIFTETLKTYYDLFLLDECESSDVLPIIKNQEWLEKTKYMQMACNHGEEVNLIKLQQEELLILPFAGDLVLSFALSTPKGLRFLSRQDISHYSPDKTLQGLYQKAKENLAAYLRTLKISPSSVGYTLDAELNLAPSMVLLYDQWKNKLNIQGLPVFALLAHDVVMLADSANEQQLESLRKLAQEVYPATVQHLSPNIFVVKNGEFELYKNAENV